MLDGIKKKANHLGGLIDNFWHNKHTKGALGFDLDSISELRHQLLAWNLTLAQGHDQKAMYQ